MRRLSIEHFTVKHSTFLAMFSNCCRIVVLEVECPRDLTEGCTAAGSTLILRLCLTIRLGLIGFFSLTTGLSDVVDDIACFPLEPGFLSLGNT
jgi:hypothetical protein